MMIIVPAGDCSCPRCGLPARNDFVHVGLSETIYCPFCNLSIVKLDSQDYDMLPSDTDPLDIDGCYRSLEGGYGRCVLDEVALRKEYGDAYSCYDDIPEYLLDEVKRNSNVLLYETIKEHGKILKINASKRGFKEFLNKGFQLVNIEGHIYLKYYKTPPFFDVSSSYKLVTLSRVSRIMMLIARDTVHNFKSCRVQKFRDFVDEEYHKFVTYDEKLAMEYGDLYSEFIKASKHDESDESVMKMYQIWRQGRDMYRHDDIENFDYDAVSSEFRLLLFDHAFDYSHIEKIRTERIAEGQPCDQFVGYYTDGIFVTTYVNGMRPSAEIPIRGSVFVEIDLHIIE